MTAGLGRARVLRSLATLLVLTTLLPALPVSAQPAPPLRAESDEPLERTEERWLREELDAHGAAGALEVPTTHRAADELLADTYRFSPHRAVRLPRNLTWSENPLRSNNWQFQFHTLRWAKVLGGAWSATGNRRYLDRYETLLRSWVARNPLSRAASPYAWNDHSTAWRAMTLVDFAGHAPVEGWLRDALRLHGRVLADDSFYVRHGNHALNQSRGLLAIGCELGQASWIDLARRRIGVLLVESVDHQGVTNEQAIDYQHYNLARYTDAKVQLELCGERLPKAFDRLEKMPRFLAHATLPNGQYELIGDTEALPARPWEGTVAEFAATRGRSGPRITERAAVFDAGYAFGRTGWGQTRPFSDEVAYSLRFGPARRLHGHLDHAGVTLYGYGSRLLLDRGKYAYQDDAYRDYVMGRSAHNVVTVDGVRFDESSSTRLSVHRHDGQRDHVVVRHGGYYGVAHQRRLLFSRAGGYLLVHDELSADSPRRFRQLWHLPEDAAPRVNGTDVRSRRAVGNVLVRQLVGAPRLAVRTGQRNPLQGWQSYRYRQIQPAPTVEAVQSGRAVTYLTLLVPFKTSANVRVRALTVVDNGFRGLFSIDGRTEGIVVKGPSASVVEVTTPFTDTFDSVFHADIERLFDFDVTAGVTANSYAPSRPVTRGEMATFLERVAARAGAPLPSPSTAVFSDIADNAHRGAIQALAAAGITEGTHGGTTFRPGAPVTRGQMASFLARLQSFIGPPFPGGADVDFTDIDGLAHEAAIRAIAGADISRGIRNGKTFSPGVTVSRGQMAAFLIRHLDHLGASIGEEAAPTDRPAA